MQNTSMEELAGYLTRTASMDQPVVDATGFERGFDFTIGWTPENMLRLPARRRKCRARRNGRPQRNLRLRSIVVDHFG